MCKIDACIHVRTNVCMRTKAEKYKYKHVGRINA